MSNNNSSSGGISFLGLLAIVFIVLKLTKLIDWSWWRVTCPLWGPAAIAAVILPFYLYLKYRKAKKEFKNAKSKWQQRMEDMQKARQLRENR